MPVTINANGASSPPRFEITISTPDGSAMTAVTLYRQVGGVKTQTRVQPSTGVASRYIEDPEAPWDTAVSYVATMTYGAGTTTTDTSAAATLTPSPAAIWAIHPTVPSRSMPLDRADFSVAGLAQMGDVTRAAQATQHRIIGSPYPLLTKVGTRLAPATSVDVTTVTESEMWELLSLTDDETPLLIRAPGGWHWGIAQGYYAVGDVVETRRLQYGPEQSRTIRLPLQQVTAPAGAQQSSWSWGGLMAGYADWPSVYSAFADWNAVTGDNPS